MGGKGGSAAAAINMTGGHKVYVDATAHGGEGGTGARAGDATASAAGAGEFVTVSSSADTYGGTGSSGTATATATGDGLSGSAESDAEIFSTGLVSTLLLRAAAGVSGHAATEATAATGGAPPSFTTAYQAVATGEGAPSRASVQAALANDPGITAAFGAHPSYFALAELGGRHGGTQPWEQIAISSIDMAVNLNQLPVLQHLIVGAYRISMSDGAGVTDVSIKVTENGNVLFDQDLGNGRHAKAYLQDHAFDLGQLPNVAMAEINVELDVTTTSADSSFFAGFVIGDPPPLDPAHAAPGPVGAPELGVAPSAHHDWVL